MSPEGWEGYELTYRRRWGYWRPIGEKAAGRDWKDIPREEREPVNQQDYLISIRVFPVGSRVTVEVDARCQEAAVPCKLELLLPPGGILESRGLYLSPVAGDFAVMRDACLYVLEGDGLRLEGGMAQHLYTKAMRGSLPPAPGMFTLCCTLMTPGVFRLTLSPEAGYLDFPS